MAYDPPVSRSSGYTLHHLNDWEKVVQTFANMPRVLDQSGADQTVQNTTSEGSLWSYSIPANTMGANDAAHLRLSGDWLANSGTPNIIVRTKLGGTTFHQATRSTIAASAARGIWYIDAFLQMRNSTSAEFMRGWFGMSDRTAPTTGLGDFDTNDLFDSTHGSAATDPTIDMTSAQTFEVTLQWSAANANLIFRRKSASLLYLPLP